ncbi:hypothetical protein SCALM49S_05205 [Streptomyces californicus]
MSEWPVETAPGKEYDAQLDATLAMLRRSLPWRTELHRSAQVLSLLEDAYRAAGRPLVSDARAGRRGWCRAERGDPHPEQGAVAPGHPRRPGRTGAPGPVEVVVVDDGSTDGARELLHRLAGEAAGPAPGWWRARSAGGPPPATPGPPRPGAAACSSWTTTSSPRPDT